jgi:replication factor C subunit 3/5
MQQGSKKIYHLEAYFAKVMSIYKNYTLLGMEDFEM